MLIRYLLSTEKIKPVSTLLNENYSITNKIFIYYQQLKFE